MVNRKGTFYAVIYAPNGGLIVDGEIYNDFVLSDNGTVNVKFKKR